MTLLFNLVLLSDLYSLDIQGVHSGFHPFRSMSETFQGLETEDPSGQCREIRGFNASTCSFHLLEKSGISGSRS